MNYRDSTPAAAAPAIGNPFARWLAPRPQMPYILPFFAYLLLMAPGALFGHAFGIDWEKTWQLYHPIIYPLENLSAAILLWALWRYYTPIRWAHIPLGILAGLFGTLLWIGTEYFDQHIGLSHAPPPSAIYNADLVLPIAWQRWLYLAVRVTGPTLVVPFMEELFFRDFLTRVFIKGAYFDEVPVGAFTWLSLLGVSACFAINHGAQWPEGFLYGLLMGILLVRTKSLGACIVAHGVTNCTLYLWVIYFGLYKPDVWQFM
jgi:CAAX prenyl protease-like protein